MLNGPFSSWPSFSEEEANAARDVLLSNKVNYWTGQECREFEHEFADFSGSKYAIALANGTVALDLALKIIGIKPGDEVVVTPRTFLASVSSIVTAGGVPVFADIDPDSQNITPETVRRVVSPRTKAVICVHLAGWPCEMDGFVALADEYNFFLIEDCAQAHGAKYKGRSVGSIGHIGCWSFCQDKIMTTGGEGGMVTTNDRTLWNSMWSYKDHGKSWEAVYERKHPPGFRWVHESFGTNWRMIEMQGAIGRIQLQRMKDWSEKRLNNAKTIWDVCRQFPIFRVPEVPQFIQHAAYKCYVFVDSGELKHGWDRDRIMSEINGRGVPCFSGSCSEVYLEKAFDNTGFKPKERLSVARELGDTSLMFLVHPTLTQQEIELTCQVISNVASECAI
ncbi:DegT/DnrJ/EryC1/StrS family aminotransferase [Saccharospirillum alexandrii]|uniref:DegT/DnrJ/EryC1/StrS family aminotransferase n=1 Tax=Saccharospirillum alexandrii TaxID=2448477 RepID=UPI003736FBA2